VWSLLGAEDNSGNSETLEQHAQIGRTTRLSALGSPPL